MKKILVAFMLLGSVTVFAAKTPEILVSCAVCHGQSGVSPSPEWPNLAGQHRNYLVRQLQDFKKGGLRDSPVMTALSANLTEEEIQELADFYAKKSVPEGSTPEKYLKRGELLYRGGDFAKQITACIACHGPKGTGNGQAGFPVLSGQHAPYTIQQLLAFKQGKRANDLNSIMRDISSHMSQEDMEAVAYYLQGLH
ncbi:MAG: cytochrome c4 [Tatlockia sp.]|nr:cytochrome c4 [Tatlockia sp.]